ncbi:hypothetical protein [Streptomyces aureocirculatus]|uniref:hypothetical protein n=1 Tax=Streptomyces aureocirculatus TaxID=67275 RepID=UPI0004C6EBE1|nr:hypothetical protein [Streptomyces aureocirculatus]
MPTPTVRGRLQRLLQLLNTALTGPARDAPDDGWLEQLLTDGEIEGADRAYCPVHQRVTAHAQHPDGTETCVDCRIRLTGPQ